MAGTARSVGLLAWLGFVPCLVAFIGITDTQVRAPRHAGLSIPGQ